MRTLAVAAGGGGDAVGILLLRRLLDLGETPLIATLAWERLIVDPVPGPRGVDGFQNLGLVAGVPAEILAETDTVPPGRSSLPRLAAETPARLFLLDPFAGSVGLAAQLRQLVSALDVDRVVVVDIGGDIVARGDEPNLLSPLADALMLSAVLGLDRPADVVVAGPGVDGELTEAEVLARIQSARGQSLGPVLPEDALAVEPLLSWHPTEASALLGAAASGLRGLVDIRRGRCPVPLTAKSAEVWSMPAAGFTEDDGLARSVLSSKSLDDASRIIQGGGASELDYERAKAELLSAGVTVVVSPAAYVKGALERGADFVTRRRLQEAVGLEFLTPGGPPLIRIADLGAW